MRCSGAENCRYDGHLTWPTPRVSTEARVLAMLHAEPILEIACSDYQTLASEQPHPNWRAPCWRLVRVRWIRVALSVRLLSFICATPGLILLKTGEMEHVTDDGCWTQWNKAEGFPSQRFPDQYRYCSPDKFRYLHSGEFCLIPHKDALVDWLQRHGPGTERCCTASLWRPSYT